MCTHLLIDSFLYFHHLTRDLLIYLTENCPMSRLIRDMNNKVSVLNGNIKMLRHLWLVSKNQEQVTLNENQMMLDVDKDKPGYKTVNLKSTP